MHGCLLLYNNLATVWLHLVGKETQLNNSLVDVTDIRTDQALLCCSSDNDTQLTWFFPNGSNITEQLDDFYINSTDTDHPNCLSLHRRGVDDPVTGIFHCDISSNDTSQNASLFVGIYNMTGGW